jgi:hypothetical protein
MKESTKGERISSLLRTHTFFLFVQHTNHKRSYRKTIKRKMSPARVLKRKSKKTHEINPWSGRLIKIGGVTHQNVFPHKYRDKYKDVKSTDFCGPNRSYPVNTAGRAHAALSRRYTAKNPEAIKNCILAKSRKKCKAGKTAYCNVGNSSRRSKYEGRGFD